EYEAREYLVRRHRRGDEPGCPDGNPHEQEEQELKEDDDARAHQRDAGAARGSGAEEPLDDQVIGAVGRRREHRAADQSTEERVWGRKAEAEVQQVRLAGRW